MPDESGEPISVNVQVARGSYAKPQMAAELPTAELAPSCLCACGSQEGSGGGK